VQVVPWIWHLQVRAGACHAADASCVLAICSCSSRRRSSHFLVLTLLPPWAHSGMFTANTMSTCIEALGMALPGSSTRPAIVPKTNE
jgi:hypothetical protein